MDTVRLVAQADYGKSGQYIARISGRHSKFTFDRDFIGRKIGKRNETTEAIVDDPGLYECCDISKKHGKDSSFHIILQINENELKRLSCSREDAMAIAKAMDAGRAINEIVLYDKDDGKYSILSAKEAEQRQAASNISSAVEQCWIIIQALPTKEAKKVLAELKNKLNPPAEENSVESPAAEDASSE